MILILSFREEPTTDLIIDWLISKGADFYRLNSEDILDKEKDFVLNVNNGTLQINEKGINIKDINVVWYRRWYNYNINLPNTIKGRSQLYNEIQSDGNEITYFLFNLLSEKTFLSNPIAVAKQNKLYTLFLAQKYGLKVPSTRVLNRKKMLYEFSEEIDKDIITKSLSNSYMFDDPKTGMIYKTFTEEIDIDKDTRIRDNFLGTLFQERIVAEHEIRTFFFDNKLYSTAILNSKTLDVKRSVGFDSENVRMVPFKLPDCIENSIIKLMDALKLNCGAIDLIKDEKGDFIFLEVNPIGQFIGYDKPANHNLPEKVADWLIKHDKK